MLPIREASYRVRIFAGDTSWFYKFETDKDIGVSEFGCEKYSNSSGKFFKNRKQALASWKEFAAINGIKKWEIIE